MIYTLLYKKRGHRRVLSFFCYSARGSGRFVKRPGTLVIIHPSGSGIRSGNPYDNILSKTAVSGFVGGGDPALESRVRVLSCISYKKYTRKKANGLSSAPSPELSAETSVTIPPGSLCSPTSLYTREARPNTRQASPATLFQKRALGSPSGRAVTAGD